MPRRDARDLLYDREPMGRLRLTPQKREFFELYSRASANAVEISRLLVELLERFPAEDGSLIKGRLGEDTDLGAGVAAARRGEAVPDPLRRKLVRSDW